jgi:hypothetical protein
VLFQRLPNGLEMSPGSSPGSSTARPARVSIAQTEPAAAGRVGSIELLGGQQLVLRGWVLGSAQCTARTKPKRDQGGRNLMDWSAIVTSGGDVTPALWFAFTELGPLESSRPLPRPRIQQGG